MTPVRTVLTAIGLVILRVLELTLGIIRPDDAGVLPTTIWTHLAQIRNWFHHSTKGAPAVASKNLNAVSVTLDLDKPTQDFCNTVRDCVLKLASGEKTQQVAQEELGAAIGLLAELPNLGPDYLADPGSVKKALALGLVDIELAIEQARALKTVAAVK